MADTIYALSSGAVPSGVAIVRISGEQAVASFGAFGLETPTPRMASLQTLFVEQEAIDRCLVLFFAGPNSFTGEDCVEFQLHGSPATLNAVLARLGSLPQFRPAEPGEFTRRAFANGRMDLTEAEALAQLIEAETEAQRRLAMSGTTGKQHSLVAGWQDVLTGLRARLEAEMDFSDEGDVPDDVADTVRETLSDLIDSMTRHVQAFDGAEIVRRGFRVALAGRPNAGKSSLLNRLAGRDVALVTEIAGTTRDRLEVSLDLKGYKVILADLAGVRETDDRVEQMGVDLARSTVREADLVLWMDEEGRGPDEADWPDDMISVMSKADMQAHRQQKEGWLAVSSATGEGVDSLLDAITGSLSERVPHQDAVPPATERQRHHLAASITQCETALAGWSDLPVELVAEHLRAASFSLGRLVGQVDAEDVLDDVFGRFCIGK